MSQNWSHGYFTEIEYTRGIYREMTPSAMRHALLIAGLQAPDANRFRYCELGCGHGLTSLAIAAVHPEAEVVAIDINPGQIAGARALADAAGLTNIRFEEWSFADMLEADIDQFDYIAAHGILTWVGAEQHQEITNIFRRKLRPGGIAYVSYNSLPGWAPMLPIRRVMQEHAKRSSRPAVERVRDATNFVRKLGQANAAVFQAMPTLRDRLNAMESLAPAYLAHEYLNEHWIPFAFPEIIDMFSGAKLTFACSATVSEHVDVMSYVPAAHELLKDIDDPIFYQTVRDQFVNQSFRKDLFVKGPLRALHIERAVEFDKLRFVALLPIEKCPTHFTTGIANMELKEEIYKPLAQALSKGPISVAELRSLEELKELPTSQLGQALTILVAQNFAAPCQSREATEAAKPFTRAVNTVLLERARSSPDVTFLMSPSLGTGIAVDPVEQLIMRHYGEMDQCVLGVMGDLAASGRTLRKDTTPLTEPADAAAHLKETFLKFDAERRPLLERLGVI